MKRVVTVPGDTGKTEPYETALIAAGIEPVFGTSLEGADGLMLMGGTDVNPARYGEGRHPETEEPDETRDAAEAALVAEALARDLPILAICRGMQMLNVLHDGGTLIQHLEPVEQHRQRPKEKGTPAHCVDIVPGTRLAGIAQSRLRWHVNSRHHQAVGRVGAGLIVSAADPRDGVIEGIERPDRRFVIGVQWHPENQSAANDENARRLFAAFAASL